MFLFDQQLSKAGGDFVCSSFDLQKVLNTPMGPHINLYYSRKYSYYNCSIYESGTYNAYAYLWGEIDGLRGCNEIVSCIYQYLWDCNKNPKFKSISLYCDSCAGQNKNRAMLFMIMSGLKKQCADLTEVKIVFLLPGHSYMPVDSIHATIERFINDKTIWAPSEWHPLIRNSRVNPKSIKVKEQQFQNFLNWKKNADEVLPKVLKDKEKNIVKTSKIKYINFYRNPLQNDDVILEAFSSYNADAKGFIIN
ncbi:unnamed protein product [Macrosiphum euphorbiae]|uniref:DUF7869 domain-containing protein n=1 Tax=Macrosiphum euphorbiae TaxID=13131 RepID=A0AAV0WH91_9HEMI|nr:unnamed protein product [Macrosiphum euphorbiae]